MDLYTKWIWWTAQEAKEQRGAAVGMRESSLNVSISTRTPEETACSAHQVLRKGPLSTYIGEPFSVIYRRAVSVPIRQARREETRRFASEGNRLRLAELAAQLEVLAQKRELAGLCWPATMRSLLAALHLFLLELELLYRAPPHPSLEKLSEAKDASSNTGAHTCRPSV